MSFHRDRMLNNFALSGGQQVVDAMKELLAERDSMRAALADISRAVMPDIGHGGNHQFIVAAAKAVAAERDHLKAVADAARTLITELDLNPIGEYGNTVCEAIDTLDEKLKALDAKKAT